MEERLTLELLWAPPTELATFHHAHAQAHITQHRLGQK
jgi:hypothetical protein